MLEKHQLTGPNFNEWFRALKLVVRTKKLHDVFETALPPAPAAGADAQALADWAVLFYRGRVQKNKPQGKVKGKRKGKGPQNSYPTKPKKPQPYKKERLAKDGQCHHCKEEGHQKRNCHVYLAELMKKKKKSGCQNVASTSLRSAARILNMVSTKKVDKNSYELWHGKVPNLSYLQVWGCEAHVKRHTSDKLQQRYVKCIFVGYPKETVGYYFYYPPENKIVVERYADLLEKDFVLQKESGRIVELEDEDNLPSENTRKHPIEEESLAPIIDPDRLCFNVKVKEHSLRDLNEPANYKAALLDPEFEKWLVAMNAKMQSIAIRILIAIAAYYDYEIWQIDVKTVFLNGFLEEEIYMEQTKGGLQEVKTYLGKCFSMKDLGEAAFILGIKIYRDRSRRLIGLSQNAYLDKILKRYRMDNSKRGSIPMQVDLHLRLRVNCYCDVGFETDRDDTKSQTGYVFILNGGAVGISKQGTMDTLVVVFWEFKLKIWLDYDFGTSCVLNQYLRSYFDLYCSLIEELLKAHAKCPIRLGYGSIMYAVRCTCPDVAFAQNITSLFQQNPGELHWTIVKNILKYLRNTKDMFFVYGGDMNESSGFLTTRTLDI
nr:hypothetical protein [Tanacetum cinerariifolium]